MPRKLALALALIVAVPASAGPAEPAWEQIADEDGVVVWQRAVPGTSLVAFRGRGLVRAPMKKLVAVLRDQTRKTEWMASCVANHAVAYLAKDRMVIYNRVGSPAPFVDDRDVVLASDAAFDLATRTIELRFRETEDPRMPPVDGVVRMPRTRGFWRLQYRDDATTDVTYQVQADPGGAIPQWLVNLASKGLPLETIQGLRRQAQKGGYEAELAYLDNALEWPRLEAQARALAVATSTAARIVAE